MIRPFLFCCTFIEIFIFQTLILIQVLKIAARIEICVNRGNMYAPQVVMPVCTYLLHYKKYISL
jgi:hypothetical protein